MSRIFVDARAKKSLVPKKGALSMKAISIIPGTNTVRLVDRTEPSVSAPDDIKLKILRVGICGTDREQAAGGRALAPIGRNDLIIGHEMFGQVTEVGKSVTRVQAGDYAVFTVRRGCGKCMPCAMNRSDMCRTGEYVERGIWKADGYQTEYVVDKEQYVVRIPRDLEQVGVLAEPLSVAEKAIDEAVRLQFARLPDALATPDWLQGRHCLVAGLGPIGLLAALALRLRGAEVFGLDIVDAGSARALWLKGIGGQYVDAGQVPAKSVNEVLGPMELIVEATGIASLEFNLLDALALNGVYVLTGIPGGHRPIEIAGSEIISRLVLGNQAMIGSVNASRDHYQMAVDDLLTARLRWGDHLGSLITNRYSHTQFSEAFEHHDENEIKTVLEWGA
jgi:threonine dehydrogenase-like Zn-dependent dehydrogenase